ncbi:MAG: VOC family protein, partial [Novosphingobium sp.]
MFSHVTLGTNNWARAKPFWQAVMGALGQSVLFEYDEGVAFGEDAGPKTFIGPTFDGNPASYGSGTHIAFLGKDRVTVDAFHTAALANGGTDEGAPGLRPHYHPNYYGA